MSNRVNSELEYLPLSEERVVAELLKKRST